MFKLITMLFPFLKELVFDSKEEYDFKSSKFNSRKFLVYVLLIVSISCNAFLIIRLYELASTNVDLKHKVMEYQLMEKIRKKHVIKDDNDLEL